LLITSLIVDNTGEKVVVSITSTAKKTTTTTTTAGKTATKVAPSADKKTADVKKKALKRL
jgi:hypothetical protein